ncbi:hypothetical protein D3C79_703780 [compost metagenome]
MTPAMYNAISSYFRLEDKSILEFGCQQFSRIYDKKSKGVFSDEHGVDNGSYTKFFYEKQGYNYDSIDIESGTILCDLNQDLPCLTKEYDIVTNFGTTEHIFNQYIAFQAIHTATKIGGRMFHFLPLNHSPHGLFNYNVDFFLSLCYANEYKIIEFKKAILPEESSDYLFCDINTRSDKIIYLFLVVEKTSDSCFLPAQQIMYLPKVHICKLKTLMGPFLEQVLDYILPYSNSTNISIVNHVSKFEAEVAKHRCEKVSLYCANNISLSIMKYADFSGEVVNIFDRRETDTNNKIIAVLPNEFLMKTYIYIATDKYYEEIKEMLMSRRDADNIIILN